MIPLPAIPWLLYMALLSLLPDFRCTNDKRESDGERYTSVCGGLYQRCETWVCWEVAR